MLFRKNIEKSCSYCVYAGKMNEDAYLCTKKGVVAPEHHCRKFKYDPLKRIPVKGKVKDFSQCDDMDFTL
ncbi:MAG: hypothetical protein J6K89_01005 [Oscillospiraceae bacterium]|nr:hypothetical protein [Oscillospiraceae bacterium]